MTTLRCRNCIRLLLLIPASCSPKQQQADSQTRNEEPFEADRFLLRWRESGSDEFGPFHEIREELAREQVVEWIQKHEAGIRAGNVPLDMIPGREFFGIQGRRVKYYPLVPFVPADSRPKAECEMKEIIPLADLHALESLFRDHGGQTEWEPPWKSGEIEIEGS